jgi:hypothetical protein
MAGVQPLRVDPKYWRRLRKKAQRREISKPTALALANGSA